MRILFAGSGEFGLPALKALAAAGHEIPMIFTQPDRPAGRGRKLTPTPIGQFAIQHSLPLVRTEQFNAEALPVADLMVVIAFGQKISSEAARWCRLGSVNLHASLLPKYRGAAPINWAILRGETVTGNSVIRLAPRMDAGNILAQSTVSIGAMETTGELHDRLSREGGKIVLDVARALESGSAIETIQDESQATSAPKLSRDSSRIEWGKPAHEIACQIRGLYPWPGCRARLIDQRGTEQDILTLVRARPVASDRAGAPGEITLNQAVGAGDGHTVEIVEVQPQGKRPMSLAEYCRGHAWEAGMRLESIVRGE
ncbi:MAG: methionyl-tRNA formyltransferase [Planctomycetota bacterium]|nr:methionyl-tRNA formyltransferase [Planctomycetota bacterium]